MVSLNPKTHWDKGKEKTLRIAWLLALWSPLTYGIAVILGQSMLMVADLIRRTAELFVLFSSWYTYQKSKDPTITKEEILAGEEKISTKIAFVLYLSALVIILRALFSLSSPSPVGRVGMGIFLGIMGIGVNGYFWMKHRRYAKKEESPMFESQWRLFRSKTVLDFWVVLNLTASLRLQGNALGAYVDPLGSITVALVLLFSAWQIGVSKRKKRKKEGSS